ncbi:MAG TPA: hypothetical protein VKS24_25065 [Bradyrhizobium sp.]|nr:hypothetical protein [Bradyrhizobium sp.]
MTIPTIQPNFSAGEITPELWGHVDLGRVRAGVATGRNVFVNYKGGLYSRAGTALVGRCKQQYPNPPPRDIQFNFSITQGYALEFGEHYMRVKSAGAYALEPALTVSSATNANPIMLTAASSGFSAASPNNAGVLSSYSPGDLITLAGGVYVLPAVLSVTNTTLVALLLNNPGIGNYAPGDTIHLAGGTQSTPAFVTVQTTKVVSATVAAGGTGGTNGTQTVTGTTGTGTKFQASVTVAGGAITAVLGILVGGDYTVNPTTPATEPVTGASLTGAQLDIVIGVRSITLTNGGVFTANASSGTFTQASSSGTGTGATFVGGIFGPNVLAISTAGIYSVLPSNPVSQASTTGASGFGATFTMTSGATAAFNNGDWVFFRNVGGMTQLNGNTYIVAGVSGVNFSLTDLDGNAIDSTSYGVFTSGGTVARIYTLTTPYAAADLPYLKYTQDTDTMSLTCVNISTGTEYPPQELKRFGATNWTIAPLAIGAVVPAPTGLTATASNNPDSGASPPTQPCAYAYVVTAVDLVTGQQSIASARADVVNTVDMSVTAGSITLQWNSINWNNPVAYNVYRTAPAYNTGGSTTVALPVPAGAQFFFVGLSYGTQLVDTNTVTDASTTPPLHIDPFAPGQVQSVRITASSNDWTTATASITSGTGSGWIGECVIVDGSIVAIIVLDPGMNYTSADTLSVSGTGTSVTGALNVGPQSGTYPGVTAYFQTRRIYANTRNQPDTFFTSQSENFTDFDSSNPPVADDAITASPFSQTVDGIQWLLPTLGGLVILTGNGAWQVTGTGGSAFAPVPITPSSLEATPQAVNGADAVCMPTKVNNDILYLSSTGQFYYELNYTIYFNSFTVVDISWTSAHFFLGQTIRQNAWCLQPYKILWAVRGDGAFLSLTWLKEQEVVGWTRHDTQGVVQGVCTVTEPPVDALYMIVQRFVQSRWLYFAERMDNRIWNDVETTWCVDCGLSTLTAAAYPSGILTVSAATGSLITVQSSQANFAPANVGDIIRAGGGILTITAYSTSQLVTGTWTKPLTALIPNDPLGTPLPIPAGQWSMLPQVTVVTGLSHLANKRVVGLLDGIPIGGGAAANPNFPGPYIVSSTGSLTLPFEASLVTIGLAFTPQVQSLYLDEGQPTVQTRRKVINNASARLAASGWPFVSINQPDGSSLDPMEIAPPWALGQKMRPTPPGQTSPSPPYQTAAGQTVQPLTTGDVYSNVIATWRKPGQLALQQPLPLPLNVTAFVVNDVPGDLPEAGISPRQQPPPRGPQRRAT